MNDEELFRLVKLAIETSQDGREWGVPDDQGEEVFEFEHCLGGQCNRFRFDPTAVRHGTNELARMRRLYNGPGREEWADYQMLRRCPDGRLVANGYYRTPADPNDVQEVIELVRWMIGHCAPEHSIPAVRNIRTGEWINGW